MVDRCLDAIDARIALILELLRSLDGDAAREMEARLNQMQQISGEIRENNKAE